MTRLCELTAAEVICHIDGREFRLTPLRVADLGEIERAIDDGTSDGALTRGFSLEQLEQFLQASAGQELAFWHCLRRHQPNLPREAASELLQQAREESRRFDQLWPLLTGFPSHHSTLGTPHSAFPSIFHRLSFTYHWTPRQICELTLPQLLAYLRDQPGESDTVWMSPAEVRARQASAGGGQATQVRRTYDDTFTGRESSARHLAALEPSTSSDSFALPGETLDQIARNMADMQLSLNRLERRDDVARYALPEAG